MGSYIPPVLQSWALGGIQAGLAAVYESRVHTISKMTVARAQFAGDTNVTVTDGSYNIRVSGGALDTPAATPKSSTAFLANSTNTFNAGLIAPNNAWGKPLIIKVRRDEGSSEIIKYAVFNADGTIPGSDGTAAEDLALDPWHDNPAAVGPRYKVNVATGEIFVFNAAKMIEHKNPDGIVNFLIAGAAPPPGTIHSIGTAEYFQGAQGTTQTVLAAGDNARLQGQDKVVGIVDFDGLQGGALSASQAQAADLSAVIQSLTSTLRATNTTKNSILSLIK